MSKLSEKIKKDIKGKKPNPKWKYISKNILKDIILLILWIVSVLGLGMLIYILSNYNPWENLPKRFYFIMHGFIGLPWELIIILSIPIGLIYYLSKKIYFIYRINPYLTSLAIILSVISGYFIAESIGLNKNISNAPIIHNIYQKQGRLFFPRRGPVWIGKIKQVKTNQLIVVDRWGKIWNVLSTNKQITQSFTNFEIGTIIKINGFKQNNNINAYSIKQINSFLRGFRAKIKQN